ncbi:hypothetical protein QFC19_000800 [Naganishia cerealis]|uniref:Uncharacterized protein n=1 Tax=Naganishia cerealis TaxID=610337 RepID=A0ACC2WMJ8_9TREE|nr:hypothetical protein QFC19_000800 [Naganishia cerealis]
MTSPHTYTQSLGVGSFPASPGINSPSTPEFSSPSAPLLLSAKQRPPATTRPGGSHLNPALSSVRPSTASRAGSGVAAGSIAATSVYINQVSADDFDKALDDFTERQVPELEVLLEQVLKGIDNAFDENVSPAATEHAPSQTTTHIQLPTLSELAKQVEHATEVCFDQRKSVRDGARAVCEIMKGAGKERG